MEITKQEFEAGTGWAIKPEGACKGEICVPLKSEPSNPMNLGQVAGALGMPIVEDKKHKLFAVGPESLGDRALTTAEAPELKLPDLNGKEFDLKSLRGKKVFLFAWAPY
jgi:hypothetical protein